jgi:two-component system, NtrC family, nitrogen regulation response regulator NtrX
MTLTRRAVLLIDDDPTIRSTVSRVLADEGWEVRLADTAQEGLTQLAGGLQPGLILLDLTMPGLTGAEFMELRQDIPGAASVPVYLFTAMRGAAEQWAALGAQGFVPKPVRLEQFLRVVEQHCG